MGCQCGVGERVELLAAYDWRGRRRLRACRRMSVSEGGFLVLEDRKLLSGRRMLLSRACSSKSL